MVTRLDSMWPSALKRWLRHDTEAVIQSEYGDRRTLLGCKILRRVDVPETSYQVTSSATVCTKLLGAGLKKF